MSAMRPITAITLLSFVAAAAGCGGDDTTNEASGTRAPPVVTEMPTEAAETTIAETTEQTSEPTTAEVLATATELADTWAEGWTESDPEMVASVFTDDGLYTSFNGSTYEGEANADHVRMMGSQVADVIRVGDLSETPDGKFTWVVEADLGLRRQRGTLEAELDGELISRLLWAENPVPIE